MTHASSSDDTDWGTIPDQVKYDARKGFLSIHAFVMGQEYWHNYLHWIDYNMEHFNFKTIHN